MGCLNDEFRQLSNDFENREKAMAAAIGPDFDWTGQPELVEMDQQMRTLSQEAKRLLQEIDIISYLKNNVGKDVLNY